MLWDTAQVNMTKVLKKDTILSAKCPRRYFQCLFFLPTKEDFQQWQESSASNWNILQYYKTERFAEDGHVSLIVQNTAW